MGNKAFVKETPERPVPVVHSIVKYFWHPAKKDSSGLLPNDDT